MYSVGEVAERLGVHWRTLHNWERAGLVSPARAGGRRVYSERDLAELRRALFLTRAERFSPRAAAEIVRLERKVAELEARLAEHERRHLTTAAAAS
ncbi:MAG TPA: MerR family transcriptional regulator [Chloroflexota bacterium]|nr:MerR family transcriptional regulator [Chloroflexota bacterium]